MAKHKFQPGNKYSKGRPPVAPELKGAKELNKVMADKILNQFIFMPVSQIQQFVRNLDNPAMEMVIARVLVEAINKGDHQRIEWLFSRLLGKMTEKVHVEGEINLHKQIVDFVSKVEKESSEEGQNE